MLAAVCACLCVCVCVCVYAQVHVRVCACVWVWVMHMFVCGQPCVLGSSRVVCLLRCRRVVGFAACPEPSTLALQALEALSPLVSRKATLTKSTCRTAFACQEEKEPCPSGAPFRSRFL